MRALRTLSFAAVLFAAATAQAAPLQQFTEAEAASTFHAANEACLKEDYKACIDGYERLVAAGYGSADLWFNLGTAYLKDGKVGPAVLNLERALRAEPSDEDARANLERARRMRVDKLVGAPEDTAGEEPLITRIATSTSGERIGWLFLALWTLGLFALLLSVRLAGGRRLAALAGGGVAVLFSLPLGAITAAHAFVHERMHEAVVVAPSVAVREGPRDTFKTSFEIHEGLKVRVMDQEGAFTQVRLSNGLEGWVPSEGVVEITPG